MARISNEKQVDRGRSAHSTAAHTVTSRRSRSRSSHGRTTAENRMSSIRGALPTTGSAFVYTVGAISSPLLFGFLLIKLVAWSILMGDHAIQIALHPASTPLFESNFSYVYATPAIWLSSLVLLGLWAWERHWVRKDDNWFHASARFKLLAFFFAVFAIALLGEAFWLLTEILKKGLPLLESALRWAWLIFLSVLGLLLTGRQMVSAQSFLNPRTRLFQVVSVLSLFLMATVLYWQNA